MISTEEILDQRGERYGEYTNVATTSRTIKEAIVNGSNIEAAGDDMRESMDMIANKLARIVNGDPYYKDSWQDIAGYAMRIGHKLDKLGM